MLPLPEFVCQAINYLAALNILLLCYKTGVKRCISMHGAAAWSSTAFWTDLHSCCAACTQGELSTGLPFTKKGFQSLDGNWVTPAQSPSEAGPALSGADRFSRVSRATSDQQEQQQDSKSAVLVEKKAILTHLQGKRGDSVPTKPSCLVPMRLKAGIPARVRSWSLVLNCPYTTRIVPSSDGGSRCGKQHSGTVSESILNIFYHKNITNFIPLILSQT